MKEEVTGRVLPRSQIEVSEEGKAYRTSDQRGGLFGEVAESCFSGMMWVNTCVEEVGGSFV